MALIKLLVEGGNMSPGPAVAQQLGPMGINMGQVISDVNEATSEFKGVTVPVHLTVDPKTKEFSIKVLSPPTSELIKKELKIEKASGARMKQRVGNFAIEQVISITKQKFLLRAQKKILYLFLQSLKNRYCGALYSHQHLKQYCLCVYIFCTIRARFFRILP